jgi:hypothetical protein
MVKPRPPRPIEKTPPTSVATTDSPMCQLMLRPLTKVFRQFYFFIKSRVLRQALQTYKQQRLDNLSSAFFFRLINSSLLVEFSKGKDVANYK